MINTKMGVFLLVGFVAGAFIASPELRAYAANTVFSTDIKDGEVKTADLANNAVTAAKVKDGEIKAGEIATDAVGADEIAKDTVGASEIKGVDKLIFADCNYDFGVSQALNPGDRIRAGCPIAGTDTEDEAFASHTASINAAGCFLIIAVVPGSNGVTLWLENGCDQKAVIKSGHVSIIVYDELPDKVPPG